MRWRIVLSACAVLLCGVAGATLVAAQTGGQQAASAGSLRPVAAFANIADQRARSAALFEEAGKVFTHPRCVNCHPRDDSPRQTDARRPHQPMVVGGADGLGAPGMRCTACHGAANFDPARVPGDGHWKLAFASMAWEGRSVGQICAQLKDPTRNGNRSTADILRHVVTDTLVLWAWNPGLGRTPAPGTNAEFVALLGAWADTGAHCPAP